MSARTLYGTAMDSKNSSPWSFILPIFLLCSSPYTHLCLGTNKLDANRSISGNQTLTSSGGHFTLGFFSPGNSTYSYIGIWYNKISVQTVVWVANRDNPITDRQSTELKVSGGNLVIVNNSEVPVWSTNLTASSSGSSSMVAVLEDDGNFALKAAPTSSVILWQSFDYPTHTWLPGAKLGIDKRKNRSQLLTSWKNAEDPSTGLFSLGLQPSSEYYVRWNKSEHYWSSGAWDNQTKSFSWVPEMRLNYIYDFMYVDNENESYFAYSIKSSFNTISRCVMDISGQLKMVSWLPSQVWTLFWSQPPQQCKVYRLCGPFSVCSEQSEDSCSCLQGFSISSPIDWNRSDWSGGCKRNSNLNCAANAEKDRFWPMSNMELHDAPQSLVAGSDLECQTACLSNCSCTAYAFEDNACSIWIGDLFNVEQLKQGTTPGRSFYVRLAASEIKDPSKKSNVTATVAGSVGAAVAILATVSFAVWRWRSGATDSSHIAVKKLESISQGEKQFRTEVSTIGTIQHVNLVRLRGFCSEGDKRLLVYDFMPNGSLGYHLFHRKDSKTLDWKTRYQIALGIARGLAYLHEKCRDCIIHCDIKPENILLDAEFCPKVADFGLAKLVGRDFSRVLTTMRGTRGYLAPEWISGVAITVKADVYSYGMMLFEFVSGRRNLELSENGAIEFFPTWAASKIAEGGDLLDLLDPDLEKNADTEELNRICRVACWCVQDEETHRPSMGQVVQVLEGLLDVNLPRIPRALQLLLDNQEHLVFFTESSSSNQNSQTRSNTSTASLQNPNSSSSMKSES